MNQRTQVLKQANVMAPEIRQQSIYTKYYTA